MAEILSVEQQRRWTEIHNMMSDLIARPDRIDALTDTFYKLIWSDIP